MSTAFYEYRRMPDAPLTLFGRRLRAIRKARGYAQDRLGVLIGLDEGCASARMSRYENGVHEPPFSTVERIADTLSVPTAYFYCKEDELAELLVLSGQMGIANRTQLLEFARTLALSSKIEPR